MRDATEVVSGQAAEDVAQRYAHKSWKALRRTAREYRHLGFVSLAKKFDQMANEMEDLPLPEGE